jgi:hypothetical protein
MLCITLPSYCTDVQCPSALDLFIFLIKANGHCHISQVG